jgi:hypothetical protein
MWRDQQLNGFVSLGSNHTVILQQEQVMLNFLSSCPPIRWCWQGNNSKFKQICSDRHTLDNDHYQGVILFGESLARLTTSQLVNKIKLAIDQVDYAYVGINRFELIAHDLPISLPDSMEQSIDEVMKLAHPKFKRLHSYAEVDGNHLVAAHPMDCYKLCK